MEKGSQDQKLKLNLEVINIWKKKNQAVGRRH